MKSSISMSALEMGKIIAASTDDLVEKLNLSINQFLKPPHQAIAGYIIGPEGQKIGPFSTLIHTNVSPTTEADQSHPAEKIACVIDVHQEIDMEGLSAAYEQVASAKRLKKSPTQRMPNTRTNITLGIIFVRDTKFPIEDLAMKLDELNQNYPERERADMVVVLSKGIINYAVQFPSQSISGDFLPPAEGALEKYIPSFYVVMTVCPSLGYGFNKMCSFIMAHLIFFSPGAELFKWDEFLEGSSKDRMTITGYQYDLHRRLMPVPRQFYNDRYIPPRSFLVEGPKGEFLSTLQFIPWQDGGVVLLKGKSPLQMFLMFLQKEMNRGVINISDGQLSYVLPIKEKDFMEMLERVRERTNMRIRPEPTKFIIQKISDEGSGSPFIARLYIGILNLRNAVFQTPDSALTFDKPHNFVMEAMLNTRTASQEITSLIAKHKNKISSGEIIQRRGHNIEIKESIDKELRREVETFLNTSVRALKQGMQNLTSILQIDISFLFKKKNAFENGIKSLEKNDPSLAAYLKETRAWSEILIESRNSIEHNGWSLPRIRYTEASGGIHAHEPEISGYKVTNFADFFMDRLTCFVEEITVHCLKLRMPKGISITEIPISKRETEAPKRFQITISEGGDPIWHIAYHQRKFEDI